MTAVDLSMCASRIFVVRAPGEGSARKLAGPPRDVRLARVDMREDADYVRVA